MSTIDEQGNCFACGPANPQGLHLQFKTTATTATTQVTLSRAYEGAPGYLHGGIIATLLDEAMSKLSRPLVVIAMTRHFDIDYLRPSPSTPPSPSPRTTSAAKAASSSTRPPSLTRTVASSLKPKPFSSS